jgi:hypothetical protein
VATPLSVALQTATLLTAVDFAHFQKRDIACAEVREALYALAGADPRDFRGRELEEVLCTDGEVDAAGGRAVRGGHLEVGWRLAAFKRLKDLDLVTYFTVLTILGPL